MIPFPHSAIPPPFKILLGLWVLLIIGPGVVAWAQTVTTAITSSGLGTTVSTSGTTTTITGGTRPGNGGNLFHSFGSFSVGAPNTANFSNETGLPTTNILSRVTGGEVSNIFGTLKTTNFGHAALWLINPAGIVFGPTASLNVGGAMHVTTADYLRLGTDGFFYADLSKNSTLSLAPVEAFGFLGDTSPVLAAGLTAGISIQGLDTQGSSVVLLGRDAVAGSGGPAIPGVAVTGRLASQGGDVTLSSVHAAGSAGVDALNLQEFSEGGRISLTQAGVVDVTHPTAPDIGGRIVIRGGQFMMTGPDTALTASVANGSAPAVDVEVNDSLLMEGGTLTTRTAGAKDAGDISLIGKNVYLKDSTLSSSSADRSTGNAGSVTLRVNGLFSSQGSMVSSEAKQGAGGEYFRQRRGYSAHEGFADLSEKWRDCASRKYFAELGKHSPYSRQLGHDLGRAEFGR